MEAGFGFGPDRNMKFFADLEGPGLASEPLLQFGTEGRTGTDSKAPSFELWLGSGKEDTSADLQQLHCRV